MKLPKLKIHQPNFSNEELVINPKDFPRMEIGDVVEIYHEEETYSRLLLQVKSLDETIQPNTVSVLNSIATLFCLKAHFEVNIKAVSPKDVALDLVELVFKEQYLSRSDMWRFRNSLLQSVVYINKVARFAEIRATVDELWSRGDRVACGYITRDTRVTFRSATAQVNIFIQLSCEMWDFDNYGDLYFEKTVQGYLVDLFSRWKEKNTNHDVTITMFSRTFYDAKTIDEFPKYMHECLRQDYRGRFYEDFYRVVVQNERYDDWTNTIIQLRTLFNQYTDTVLNYHRRPGFDIPTARNSTAAEGNFLEVLNMGLNIYEKFYLDRNFDRTGKLSLVITPGPGVFEVDRELTFITKQRTIDCGNSCDLVCMGEQPLHVVPLLKFHNTNPGNTADVGDDYNIPHWINHSFYMSENQEAHMKKNKFLPRIRAPVLLDHTHMDTRDDSVQNKERFSEQPSPYLESDDVPFVDYDAYDAQVFSLSGHRPLAHHPQQGDGLKRNRSTGNEQPWSKWRKQKLQYTVSIRRELGIQSSDSKLEPCEMLSTSYDVIDRETSGNRHFDRHVVGSCGSPVDHRSRHSLYNYRPSRALINPFTPSRLHFKVTSNRRRWAHAFPTNTYGASVQPHHQHSISSVTSDLHTDRPSPPAKPYNVVRTAYEMRRQRSSKFSDSDLEELAPPPRVKNVSVTVSSSSDSGGEGQGRESQVTFKQGIKKTSSQSNLHPVDQANSSTGSGLNYMYPEIPHLGSGRSRSTSVHLLYSRSSSVHKDMCDFGWEEDHNWMFGVTGEQEWTPEIQTGMDWKSMMRPASLPITTDYFPDRRSLNESYYVNPYTLTSEHFSMDIVSEKRRPLSMREVYNEMVYQRISQGFQIVLHDKPLTIPADPSSNMSPSPYQGSILPVRKQKIAEQEEMVLSIGRIFHHLKLDREEITVKRIWPKHPYPQKFFKYTYRFQVPDSQAYDVSWTEFRNEKLEHYNWNYVDQYICTRGEDDNFLLTESMKYWRARFFLLPANSAAIKKISEGPPNCRCDLYDEKKEGEEKQRTNGFMKFVEAINKIRRPPHARLPPRTTEIPKRRVSLPVSPMAGSGSRPEKITSGAAELPYSFVGSPVLSLTHQRDSASPVPSVTLENKAKFQRDTPHHELIEAMLDPSDGLHFLNDIQDKLLSLPQHCFLAREAVWWLKDKMEGVEFQEVLDIMQKMLDEKFICHASGDVKHKTVFENGFVMYCILYDKDKKEILHHAVPYNSTFTYEWVEVVTHMAPTDWSSKQPAFLLPQLPDSNPTKQNQGKRKATHFNTNYSEKPDNRTAYVEVDPALKSDRTEWGTARVHSHYQSEAAFELELQWLVATGCILGELVSGWARKASLNGFHFLPVPGDPFALPFTPNSDPLRGPIFVPLNVDCLKDSPDSDPFEDYPEESRAERLLLFQHYILKRYGFMADKFQPGRFYPSLNDPAPPTYIHLTGGMFAMIPNCQSKTNTAQNIKISDQFMGSQSQKSTNSLFSINQSHRRTRSDVYLGSQSQTITPCDLDNKDQSEDSMATIANSYKVGFLWSWNFLLTKKWRSQHTGDEHYQDKMLADFRAFCSNSENRLREYLDDCRSQFMKFGNESYDDILQGDSLDTVTRDLLVSGGNMEVEQ